VDLGGEILPPILFSGPGVSKRGKVVTQFVADAQSVGGFHL
jgi:hypothetical protein